MWPGMQRMTTKRCHQFYGGDYKYIHARCSRLSTYQIKPNKAYQPNQTKKKHTKSTRPNLFNQTYQTKPTKTNLPHQTNQIKHRKPNLGILVLKGTGKCFLKRSQFLCDSRDPAWPDWSDSRCKEFREYFVWNCFFSTSSLCCLVSVSVLRLQFYRTHIFHLESYRNFRNSPMLSPWSLSLHRVCSRLLSIDQIDGYLLLFFYLKLFWYPSKNFAKNFSNGQILDHLFEEKNRSEILWAIGPSSPS